MALQLQSRKSSKDLAISTWPIKAAMCLTQFDAHPHAMWNMWIVQWYIQWYSCQRSFWGMLLSSEGQDWESRLKWGMRTDNKSSCCLFRSVATVFSQIHLWCWDLPRHWATSQTGRCLHSCARCHTRFLGFLRFSTLLSVLCLIKGRPCCACPMCAAFDEPSTRQTSWDANPSLINKNLSQWWTTDQVSDSYKGSAARCLCMVEYLQSAGVIERFRFCRIGHVATVCCQHNCSRPRPRLFRNWAKNNGKTNTKSSDFSVSHWV